MFLQLYKWIQETTSLLLCFMAKGECFHIELLMDAMGRASPLEDAEACIYGYGALKFLTMNNQLLLTSLHCGALELMVLHIKIVNNAVS